MLNVINIVLKLGVILSLVGVSACATPQEEMEHFQYAAMSAVRDFNVMNKPIPTQLKDLQNPYGYTPHDHCEGWYHEAHNLMDAMEDNQGRRVGHRRDASTVEGRFGNLRDKGVQTAATFFTPHRGLVRQVTGAAAYQQQAYKADQRARERLGYLIGLGRSNRCPGF